MVYCCSGGNHARQTGPFPHARYSETRASIPIEAYRRADIVQPLNIVAFRETTTNFERAEGWK